MEYECYRCGEKLEKPLDQHANYIMPTEKDDRCRLVCSRCLRKTDRIIWGVDKKVS